MEHQPMAQEYCPGAKFVGFGILDGYWLVYDGFSSRWQGAVANIVPSRHDEVWGGIFKVTEEQLLHLDKYKGSPRYYQRKLLDVLRPGSKEKIQAWAYYRDPLAAGIPSRMYLESVIRGARDCHLPEDYIHSVLDILHQS